jgi:hypothetical protein
VPVNKLQTINTQIDDKKKYTVCPISQRDWLWYHRLQVAKLRERLLVSKWAAQIFDMQKSDLRQLNNTEVKDQIKIWNRCAALENLDDIVDINRAWENIRGNINMWAKGSLGHYELKQINHGVMKNVQNYYNEVSRLNWSGCRTQARWMEINWTM